MNAVDEQWKESFPKAGKPTMVDHTEEYLKVLAGAKRQVLEQMDESSKTDTAERQLPGRLARMVLDIRTQGHDPEKEELLILAEGFGMYGVAMSLPKGSPMTKEFAEARGFTVLY